MTPSLEGKAGEGLLMSGEGLGSSMIRIRAVPVPGVPPAVLMLSP
jgi:hypothetical protein